MKEKLIGILVGCLLFVVALACTTSFIDDKDVVPYFPHIYVPHSGNETDIRIATDQPYSAEHPRQKLDLYVPPPGDKPTQCLLFVHGGGWSSGDRSMYGHIGRHFAKNGYLTAVISYRLSPEVRHPAHAQDAASAFTWLHANASRYGGDTSRISLMGHSSGAHTVALVASDPRYLTPHGLHPRDVKSVVGLSGIYTINRAASVGGYAHVFPRSEWVAASATSYVPKAPVMLVYAEKDYPTLASQSKVYHDHLTRRGVSSMLVAASRETHESVIINACIEDKMYNLLILKFLAR